jgi:hypothetical protein
MQWESAPAIAPIFSYTGSQPLAAVAIRFSVRDATRAAAGAILSERGRSVGRLLADEACATGSCNAGAAMRVYLPVSQNQPPRRRDLSLPGGWSHSIEPSGPVVVGLCGMISVLGPVTSYLG